MPWPKGKKFNADHIAKRGASLIKSGMKRKRPYLIEGKIYWKCGTCKFYKHETEFYIDGKTASGTASVCKRCHSESTIRTRDKGNARRVNAEYMRRARSIDPEKFRKRERLASIKKRKNDPQKVAARNALNNAVKRGDVAKPLVCELCSKKLRLSGHHDDYSRPLDVVWLCHSCHGEKHRAIEFKRVTA